MGLAIVSAAVVTGLLSFQCAFRRAINAVMIPNVVASRLWCYWKLIIISSDHEMRKRSFPIPCTSSSFTLSSSLKIIFQNMKHDSDLSNLAELFLCPLFHFFLSF